MPKERANERTASQPARRQIYDVGVPPSLCPSETANFEAINGLRDSRCPLPKPINRGIERDSALLFTDPEDRTMKTENAIHPHLNKRPINPVEQMTFVSA